MWDEVATLSLNPSYQPLNEASIPDRTLDGYALKAAWRTPGEPTALSGATPQMRWAAYQRPRWKVVFATSRIKLRKEDTD